MFYSKSVFTTHQEYEKALPDWKLVDDVIKGDVAKYLRQVSRCEATQEAKLLRQNEYEDGAILHNFTLRTRDGMQGAMFLRSPTITMPERLEYLLNNADGNGLGLEQHMRKSADQVLRKGRAGLLVDMPSTEEAPTLAQIENGEMVPRIQLYEAQHIVNWVTVRYGSISKLRRIVLREEFDSSLFGDLSVDYLPKSQYRVLELDDAGVYFQEVWHADASGNFSNTQNSGRIDITANGQPLNYIPFFFEGADDNSPDVSTKPLLPIAKLNIGHYRNSADTEENSFICSQAMLVIALGNVDAKAWAEENPNGVQVGSRRGLSVGTGGDAKFIQAAESDKAMRLMERKEEQAIQLGAQLITPSRQVTAETARIQQGANGSILASISSNVTSAYRAAIRSCMDFLGIDQDYTVQLGQDFFYQTLTAQERAQWVSEVMTGITPVELFYNRLKQTGEYPDSITLEEIGKMLNDQGPMGGFGAEDTDGDE